MVNRTAPFSMTLSDP